MAIKRNNVGQKISIMLSNITWTEFFAGILLLTSFYYLYVAFRYYPDKLKGLLGKTNHPGEIKSPFVIEESEPRQTEETENDEESDHSDLDDIEELITKLVSAIEEASVKQLGQSELKWSLELLLHEKPALKNSPYRPSINELIASECAKNGTYSLSEKEVDKMWEK